MENLFLFEEDEQEILTIEDIDMYLEESKLKKNIKKGREMTIDRPEVKKVVNDGKVIAKSIYKMNDRDFTEGKFIPILSRLIVRSTAVYGLYLLNPTLGVIAFVTDRIIKKHSDIKQRKRLRKYYSDKLEWIEDRISSCSDDKEKYKLIKLRSALKSNIRKLDTQVLDNSFKSKLGRL